MLRIASHIERLLFLHDCVVLPGMGGFVLQTVSATYKQEQHAFVPMRKEIAFNASLQHTDGLLVSSYMQNYGTDFRKAQELVNEDIEELKSSLQQVGKVSLGTLGSFTRGEIGQPVFIPGKVETFDTSNYGLSSFHFPVLPQIEEVVRIQTEEKKKKADVFYIPINRRLARTVGASAAALALFFLISTPVKDVNQSAYTASIIPTEHIVALHSNEKTADIPETPFMDAIETEITGTTTVFNLQPVPSVATTTTAPLVTDKGKTFYIVIGSFPSEAQASLFISGLEINKGGNAGTVVRDNKYRVYANSFDNRQEADTYLAQIRQNEKYQSAWMYISK